MERYPYVIVGGGMAADAAIQGIRRRDRQGAIVVLSDDPFPPYQRPPLSKKLWLDMRMEEVWLPAWQRQPNVHLWLNRQVTAIDRSQSTLTTADGQTIPYDRLLLATGGSPRRIPGSTERVVYVGSMAEHVRLWRMLSEPADVLVVGGGFIGAEMSAVLSARGHHVTWLMPEEQPFERFFPEDLAKRVTEEYRRHGVVFATGETADRFQSESGGVQLITAPGRTYSAAAAVVGVGLILNDQLATAVGLADGQGIPVNAELQTHDPHIWAAGDVAILDGRPAPMLHEDHAVTQGRMAGENMAGAHKQYTHEPFYYSDLYHFGYEAIGLCDTRFEMVEDWVSPLEEGVVYYLDQGRVVGVLNWNVWDQVPKAREILESGRIWTAAELAGQIRNR